MPRILVADDNSNIQKMVTLALKDLGIDVVAVGNGEAAVRKLADAMPDMVLADIFMPVRNGYEVCEFIKQDGRYGHIPVVLLVGTFDPLDEKEVVRVGADGVLKKPFVPPDALIATVKTLLEKVGAVSAKAESKERQRIPAPAPIVPPDWSPTGPPSAPPEPEPEEYETRRMPVAFQGEEAPPAFSEFFEGPSSTEGASEVEEAAQPAKPPSSDWDHFASEVAPDLPAFGTAEAQFESEGEKQAEETREKGRVPRPSWEPGAAWRSETSTVAENENIDATPPASPRAFASPWALPTADEPEEEAPAGAAPAVPESRHAAEGAAPSKLEATEAAIAEAAARVISFPEVAAEIFSGPEHEPAVGPHAEAETTADIAPSTPPPKGPWSPLASEPRREETQRPNPMPPTLDPATVDAVVERVMSQLQPQIVEMISRNVVRPIVAALLQREIEKHE